VIDKAAHAPGLRSLNGDQPHMTPDVIAMAQKRELRFVAVCITLQTFDALLNQKPESSADFESFTRIGGSIFDSHRELLARALEIFCSQLKLSLPLPMLSMRGSLSLDYEAGNLRNLIALKYAQTGELPPVCARAPLVVA
jgi:hypothetical protein